MRHTLISLAVGLAVSGCTSIEERQTANGGFGYVDKGQSIALEVPETLDKPQFRQDFEVPNLSNQARQKHIGSSVKVVAPALVLPVVSGSRIEEGLKQAVVSFDMVDESQPLDTAIWNSLISYLDEQGIAVDKFDKDEQILVTDWLVLEEEVGGSWLTWSSSERREGRRFEFSLDVKPHGRSASLTSKMVDYLETVDGELIDQKGSVDKRRHEVDVLNKVIGHYAYQIRVIEAKRIAKIRRGFESRMGFDRDGESAFLVDAEYEIAWSRLLLILRKLGFDVQDLDKSNGLLFVRYRGEDTGWWDNLWGSKEELPIDKTEYRFEVLQAGKQTSVTIANNDNVHLDAELMTVIYERFSDLMSDGNLDI